MVTEMWILMLSAAYLGNDGDGPAVLKTFVMAVTLIILELPVFYMFERNFTNSGPGKDVTIIFHSH